MKFVLQIFFITLVSLLIPSRITAVTSIEISNFQQINDYYSVDVVFTGTSSTSANYIQAVFTKPGNPHYFGSTWSSKGDWFNYISSPEKDFIKENFPKVTSGEKRTVLLNIDASDPDYKGPGDYIFKIKRYTGESNSSAGESNEITASVSGPSPIEEPTQSPTNTSTTNTPSPTPTPSPSPSSTTIQTPIPTKLPTKTPIPQETLKITQTPTPTTSTSISPSISISLVLGNSTDSATQTQAITPTQEPISPKEQKLAKSRSNKFFITTGALLIAPAAIVFFIKYKDKIS